MSIISRGYDYVPPSAEGGGDYLKFSKEPGTIRVRLIGDPIIFEEQTPFGPKVCAAWVCLHKEMVDGKPVVSAKTFKGGMTIFGPIRTLLGIEEWGDPAGYDVQITKTGTGKESKYSVAPMPHSSIKPEHMKLVEEANFNLEARYLRDMNRNGEAQGEDAPAHTDNDDPWADE